MFASVCRSCLPVCAQPVEAQSRFRVGVDIARYRGDSTKEYLEVYYSFDVSKLKFVKVDTALKAEAVMEIYFKRSANDSIVAQQIWRIPFTTNDSSLLGVFTYCTPTSSDSFSRRMCIDCMLSEGGATTGRSATVFRSRSTFSRLRTLNTFL